MLAFACSEAEPATKSDDARSTDDDDEREPDDQPDEDDSPSDGERDAGRRDAGARDASTRDARTPMATPPAGQTARDAGLDARSSSSANDASSQPSAPVGDAGGSTASGGSCGAASPNDQPFGCEFAWGRDDPGGSLASYAELDFMSKWVGYELKADGSLPSCDGCKWLSGEVAKTPLIPIYYAYFVGFLGKANGLPDQNEAPDKPNLATHAAQLVRDKRAQLIDIYASYAKQSAAVWPDKPLVWLLEGDFVQYTRESQTNPLTMAELGELARDITCAIKGNMPKAVVAINHSTWNSDEVTNEFWGAMDKANYDLVWTTGVANNDGFFEQTATPSVYNKSTAKYAYVSEKTRRKILVDTSFGLSAMADTWASATPEALNARIADGVIAAHVTMLPTSQLAPLKTLSAQLDKVCK
jgi:hypothetical protein